MFERDIDDAFIRYMNKLGYQPIVVPRGGLLPPGVYRLSRGTAETGGRNRYILVRTLSSLVREKKRAAFDTQPARSVDLGDTDKTARAGKATVSFLDGLLARFGFSGASLKAAADQGRNVSFSFKGTEIREVLPGDLLDAIRDVPPEKFGLADLAAGVVHIAYGYIYARSIGVSVGGSQAAEIDLGANIDGAAKLGLGGKASKASGSTMSHGAGREPLAIAFSVARLDRKAGDYSLEFGVPQGAGAGPREAAGRRYLFETGRAFAIEEAEE